MKKYQIIYADLLNKAWEARGLAYPWKSGTKVGCAIETEAGSIAVGWNIEGLWMTSIHAEVCALKELVAWNTKGIRVAIVSETSHFTPCGACLDWLFQFCIKDAEIIIQNKEREIIVYKLSELCPHYPRQ